ncbi:hypothetical protein LguiB_028723 [Lonicera macranthoides]
MFEYSLFESPVEFSHSSLMLRRMLGDVDIPPPAAKSIRVFRLDRRTRFSHISNKARLGG